ncbi:MAG: UDP-N-acetylglucosamine--N-acetylmuramyl-(pentapeptide) pyrophosphoryl-undecaprenol N-acetylglucosamine transferase [Acidimicrobiia bacterium]
MTGIAIAAAGSGGHVYPALAVADALVDRGIDRNDIVFFGGDRMEATAIPDAGYTFVGVDIHGIRRSLSVDNLTLPAKVRDARRIIAAEMDARGVGAMVVFGGYVAGPAALAASKNHVPLVVHEANAVPGVANRLIARRADTVFAAFEPTTTKLVNASVIGSPLRSAFTTYDRDSLRQAARDRYGLAEDATVLGVVGGSLGAQFLNDVTRLIAKDTSRDFDIVHITGHSHHAALAEEATSHAASSSHGGSRWVTVPFEENMVDLYAVSDLVLCRSGALTISELQATHTPAVVVPLPAGKGYQAENATDLVAAGGAIVEPQSDPATVAAVVQNTLASSAALTAMAAAEYTVDHRLATSVMTSRILEVADA